MGGDGAVSVTVVAGLVCATMFAAVLYLYAPTAASTNDAFRSRTAVILMTRSLSAAISARLARLVDVGLDAHVVLDVEAPAGGPSYGPREHFIPTAAVERAGVTDLTFNTTGRHITAWERAVMWCHAAAYDYCWLVEDDVLWEDPAALAAAVHAYAPDHADLVAKLQGLEPQRPDWFFWDSCEGVLPGPRARWVASFDPICRVSRSLVDALLRIAAARGRLCYLETIFSTVVSLDDSARPMTASYFNVKPPPGVPRMCIRWKPPFVEEREWARVAKRRGRNAGRGPVAHAARPTASQASPRRSSSSTTRSSTLAAPSKRAASRLPGRGRDSKRATSRATAGTARSTAGRVVAEVCGTVWQPEKPGFLTASDPCL